MAEIVISLILAITGIARDVDPALMAKAEQRMEQVTSCPDVDGRPGPCWSHYNIDYGTGEVLAWNAGSDDPARVAVEGWRDSPTHWAILSDPDYIRIGCAHQYTHDRHYFVCIVGVPLVTIQSEPVPEDEPAMLTLPDTAMRR